MSAYSSKAIGGDTETFRFDRAYMAPQIVCAQHGRYVDGEVVHEVVPTARARDALAWMLEEHDQIWFHNGLGFDAPAILASYPELAPAVWGAFERGAFLDTMFLQRLIQIARGDTGGPLDLAGVCQSWSIEPPTKVIEATVPAGHPRAGEVVDVRTSFGLWYGADEIPDPWYSYADYDGIVQPKLAKRQVDKYCTPPGPGRVPQVRLEDLAQVCRTYFGLSLARVYGLRVDPNNTAALANAAHNAVARLQEVAIDNGFLKRALATRNEVASGHVAGMFCAVRDGEPPAKLKDDRARARWAAKQAAHAHCQGCKYQASEAAMTNRKRLKAHKEDPAANPLQLLAPHESPGAAWKLDTKTLSQAISVAYEGKPPLTEPKVDKKTGKKTGGGTIARSRDVLQDSGSEDLETFSEYNEWGVVLHKDLVMFEQSPIHAGIGVTNNLRPSSFAPNVLNLRRDGFIVVTCPNPACGYETTWDKPDYVKWKKEGAPAVACPACEGGVACP